MKKLLLIILTITILSSCCSNYKTYRYNDKRERWECTTDSTLYYSNGLKPSKIY